MNATLFTDAPDLLGLCTHPENVSQDLFIDHHDPFSPGFEFDEDVLSGFFMAVLDIHEKSEKLAVAVESRRRTPPRNHMGLERLRLPT